MVSFGDYLKKERKRLDLTQEYLAQALDVSNTYIHQLETGKIDAPNFERCRQLAKALSVDVHELWEPARRERLAKYAERAGVTLEELFNEVGGEVDGVGISAAEQSLVRLFRKLDLQTKKDFNGLIAMLFRHLPEPELQRELERYLKSA
jgi:transcriptional regulator with XRE-family HTH domain